MNKLFLLITIFFISVLLIGFVSAAPPDDNSDGCVSLGEISSYVASWLSGQVTLSQVSQAVSAWLQGCSPPPTSGSLYSAAYPLTWPPPLTNLDKVGAESNPTGNPIGGYHGYDRIVHPSQADYIVHNKQEFLALFNFNEYGTQIVQEGDIVYIDDNAVIDLTGVWDIFIPANITIASGRGRGFSKGGLIRNLEQKYGPDSYSSSFFILSGPNIRITGLRIQGPDQSQHGSRHYALFYISPPRPDLVNDNYYLIPVNTGISSRYPFFEIDNNEVFGWTNAISLGQASPEFGNSWAYGGTNPVYGYNSSLNNYVHHNYIHHNIRAGWGYGVNVGGYSANTSVSVLIEGNLFNRNRHSVASAAAYYGSYEARYNYVLEEGTHIQFDRHGGGTGYAGLHTVIHHNTDMMGYSGRGSIGVAGPGYPPGVSRIYNNWLKHNLRMEGAIGAANSEVFGNSLNVSPPQSTVLSVPVINVDKDELKMGESISFSASDSVAGSSPLSYVCWDYGDSSPEDCGFVNDVKTHSYTQPGRYLVTLKLVDIKGVPAFATKSLIVHYSNPDAVILSFWIRDSYNQIKHTNSSPGYFKKRVLIDGQEVWGKDLYDDGWEWEHVVIDITNYVDDESTIDFQIQTLQNYQRQNYPAPHPFDIFQVFIDDVYISNRDYSVENFGDWEADVFSLNYMQTPTVRFNETSAAYFYKVGDDWWRGEASFESKNSGKYAYMIDSNYRMSSTAGTTRGFRQTIRAPVAKTLIDIKSNDKGMIDDYSSYQRVVSFAGSVDGSNNFVNDFFGNSKRLNGDNNFITASNMDLSQSWVLDLNVFLPYVNSQQTLMYASSGSNFVHVYYSPTNQVVLKTNSAEVSCNLPSLSHNRFNKIVVGRSCTSGNCVLSCASNGVVNVFSSNPIITLTGTSSVSFGGYSSGTTNLFGAINYVKILRSGSLSSSAFADLSSDDLQGAWYFRGNTNGVFRDASSNGNDVSVPSGWNFGIEGQRAFATITSSNPRATITRDSSMTLGDDFSVEFVARFNNLNQNSIVVDGLPFRLYNEGWIDPGWSSTNRIQLVLKLSNPSLYISDPTWAGWQGVSPMDVFENNKWYHMVFTKEGNYLRSYVNGKVNKKFFMPGVPYDTSSVSDLLLGGFSGNVQRFVTWDKALTDSDVEVLYKSSLVGCSDSDNDGYGGFPRSGVINGCRFDGFDCNDANAGVGAGGC